MGKLISEMTKQEIFEALMPAKRGYESPSDAKTRYLNSGVVDYSTSYSKFSPTKYIRYCYLNEFDFCPATIEYFAFDTMVEGWVESELEKPDYSGIIGVSDSIGESIKKSCTTQQQENAVDDYFNDREFCEHLISEEDFLSWYPNYCYENNLYDDTK